MFPFSFVRGEAVAIRVEVVSMLSWVWCMIREGKEVFRIRESRACTRAHTFMLWLSPSEPRLWICFGGSRSGPKWVGRCFGSERGGLVHRFMGAW